MSVGLSAVILQSQTDQIANNADDVLFLQICNQLHMHLRVSPLLNKLCKHRKRLESSSTWMREISTVYLHSTCSCDNRLQTITFYSQERYY